MGNILDIAKRKQKEFEDVTSSLVPQGGNILGELGGLNVGNAALSGLLAYLSGGVTNAALGTLPGFAPVASAVNTVMPAVNAVNTAKTVLGGGGLGDKLAAVGSMVATPGLNASSTPTAPSIPTPAPSGGFGDILGSIGNKLQPNAQNVGSALQTGLNVLNKPDVSMSDAIGYGMKSGSESGLKQAMTDAAQTKKTANLAKGTQTAKNMKLNATKYNRDPETGDLIAESFEPTKTTKDAVKPTQSPGAKRQWVPEYEADTQGNQYIKNWKSQSLSETTTAANNPTDRQIEAEATHRINLIYNSMKTDKPTLNFIDKARATGYKNTDIFNELKNRGLVN